MTNNCTSKGNQFHLLGEVARMLHVRPHQIVYLIQSRQIEEPAMRLGNRRIFQPEDVKRLAEMLNKMRKTNE